MKDGSGKLSITKTPNAENPVVHGQVPLLTIDVWEHAYVSGTSGHWVVDEGLLGCAGWEGGVWLAFGGLASLLHW